MSSPSHVFLKCLLKQQVSELTGFQFRRTKLPIYLHCSGIGGSSVIDDMPSAYQALPEVSKIEGQHNTSKQTVRDRSWGWQCVAGAEHGS